MKKQTKHMGVWILFFLIALLFQVNGNVQAAAKKTDMYVLTSSTSIYSQNNEKSSNSYTYNSNGLLTKIRSNFGGGSNAVIKVFYNKKNQVIKSTYTSDGYLYASMKMSYNSSGKLTKRKRYLGNGKLSFTNTFTYDSKGKLKKITTPEECGYQPSSATFTYNSQGLVSKIIFGTEGKVTYKYDKQGNKTYENRGDKLKYTNTYKNGLLVKTVCSYPFEEYINGKVVKSTEKITTTYKYKKIKVNKNLKNAISDQQWACKNEIMPQIYFMSFWSY